MDHGSFDRLTLRLRQGISRRATLGGLGLAALGIPGLTEGKKRKRKKRGKGKKKVTFNEFGCVSTGAFCQNNDQCCSGICTGNTGKKRCQAHDTGGCQLADDTCLHEGSVRCPDHAGGASKALVSFCFQTTGQAGFCGIRVGNQCVVCAKDADCVAGFGAGAACIVCASDCAETNHATCVPAEI